MGEIAEMMLDGTMDPETGEFNFDGAAGPGFPLTAAEAARFASEAGWLRGRRIKPRERRPLYGFWADVARAVRAGSVNEDEVAEVLGVPTQDVARAVYSMARTGHMVRKAGRLSLTKVARAQFAKEARD